MTFTVATIKKLRALGLDEPTVERVLEIFEEARVAKSTAKGSAVDRQARGTRLPEDWQLPPEWRDWALAVGLRQHEINREETKFKNYWLNAAGAKGLKLKWKLTWENWCISTLERAGRTPNPPPGAPSAPTAGSPDGFDEATWAAISKRFKGGAPWSPDWGPPPNSMGCLMPVQYL